MAIWYVLSQQVMHQAVALCRAMPRFKDGEGVQKQAADAMLIPRRYRGDILGRVCSQYQRLTEPTVRLIAQVAGEVLSLWIAVPRG